jgi:hypothetical protein
MTNRPEIRNLRVKLGQQHANGMFRSIATARR